MEIITLILALFVIQTIVELLCYVYLIFEPINLTKCMHRHSFV